MKRMFHRVFVYGTLRRNYGNHRLLSESAFFGETTTAAYTFAMFGQGIPYVYPVEIGWRIKGEVYEVDDETLEDLDRLEGNGYHYERRPVRLRDNSLAWMYHGMRTPWDGSISPEPSYLARAEAFVPAIDGVQDWATIRPVEFNLYDDEDLQDRPGDTADGSLTKMIKRLFAGRYGAMEV
jgi:gamma-glutamylaminecyclotransferase